MSSEELGDALGRYNWFLGDIGQTVSVEGIAASSSVVSTEEVPYLDPRLVHAPPACNSAPEARPHLLIHRVTPGSLWKLFLARGAASIVDSRLYFLNDSLEYLHLRKTLQEKSSLVEASSALRRLMDTMPDEPTALVLGTGPSARAVLNREIDHDLRVMCNSAIRDRELVDHVRPNLVTFGDHVFHFGPSRYAAAFREDVLRFAEGSDCLFAVPDYGAELILAKYPELAGRVISVSIEPGSPHWRSMTPEDTSVRVTGNVLTQFMLPAAFGIARHIDIAGCDGREPGEKYFWSHGKTVQYSDELMRTVFEAHASFFRDNDYADYYDRHCAQLEDFIQWAESSGKTVRSVAASHIPALANRLTVAP